MIRSKLLKNGIKLVMEDIPYVKSVAIGIFVKAGACDEESKYAGVSHFIEHMMFKGTERRTAKQIAEDADRIAGNINAYTAKENTCYHIKTLSSNIEQALDILLDIFLYSRFNASEMTKERQVIFEEMSMVEDTPDDLAYDLIMENLFKGNPLEKSIIGTHTSLKNVSRRVLKEYIDREYTKDSIVISIAGNFDEDKVCKILENSGLAEINEKKKKKKYKPIAHIPRYTVRVKDIEQSHIMLATRGMSMGDDDYYAMVLLNNIMGGSMSSRLFQNVREEKGLAYSVYSMTSSHSEMGAYCIYAGVGHNKIKSALDGIKEELENVSSVGVTDDELSMAKEQLKGGYIYSQENVNQRMLSIGKNMLLMNKIYTAEEVLDGIDSVNMDDMRRVISRIGDINKYSCVLVTNKRVNLKGMIKS